MAMTEGFPDLAGWCGHPQVSLRTWQCPDCDVSLPDAARARLEAAETKAPPGYVWVLDWCEQEGSAEPDGPCGVYSDRSKIKDILLDALMTSESFDHIHWYQSVINRDELRGWEEGTDATHPMAYGLSLFKIDGPI